LSSVKQQLVPGAFGAGRLRWLSRRRDDTTKYLGGFTDGAGTINGPSEAFVDTATNRSGHMSQPTVNVVNRGQATLGGVFPILRVADLEASLRYYETQLGFAAQWRSGAVASVQRDRAAIMLCQGDQGHAGTWLWIAVSDADAIYTELQARGALARVSDHGSRRACPAVRV
jgi:hypothetical protein